MSKIRKYTKEEEELILNNSLKKANTLSHLELANMLGRTVEGIRKKEKELKRRRTYDKRVVSDRWTDEDIKYMKDMIASGKISILDITKALKKDFKVVEAKMLELAIANRKKGKAWRLWTAEEEDYLRRWHGIERPIMIGIYLGRSLESIHQKAKKMKLGNKKVYYSANECSKLLGIEPSTFIRHINSGYIRVRKAVTEQLIYQIRIEDLYEFMENHQDKWDSRNLAYEPFLTEKPDWYIEKCKKDLQCKNSEIAIISFEDSLLYPEKIEALSQNINSEFLVLKDRETVNVRYSSGKSNPIVLSSPYNVNGLEFKCVILVGVDEGRVPQNVGVTDISANYIKYSAFNQLYLTSSRAKFRLILIGNSLHGVSSCLQYAIENERLEVIMHN